MIPLQLHNTPGRPVLRQMPVGVSLAFGMGVAAWLTGCRDITPLSPKSTPPHSVYLAAAIKCSYASGDTTVDCVEYAQSQSQTLVGALAAVHSGAPSTLLVHPRASPRGNGLRSQAVYLGQQGYNVNFITNSVALGGGMFSFNAAVQDLTTEPLGTADGRTPASDSIDVFFYELPVVTAGSGTISISNAPFVGTFTSTNQPYFQYPGLLPSNATSIALPWQFSMSTTVTGFAFSVDIAAQVPDTSASGLNIPPHVFNTLAVGEAHTCAIRPTAHEYCWGFNEYGALGIQPSTPVTTPRGVLGALAFQSIAAGAEFSCGIVSAGSAAYCWGDNGSGEVGDGSLFDRGEPTALAGSFAFSALAAGNEFSCGLVAAIAYCWGDNYVGQLGDGTTNPHSSPQPVGGTQQFVQITAGSFHACGLTSGNALYCWGDNSAGEIGDGTLVNKPMPVLISSGTHFEAVAAGNGFTCALDTTGKAYCWGANVYGALGNGSIGGMLTTPTLVSGGHVFSRLTAGAFHACGATGAGATFCWGDNSSGQIGNGTNTDRNVPTATSGANAFTAIGAGFAHTCALTSAGATYCWGDNSSGQIGDGTQVQRQTPTAVALP